MSLIVPVEGTEEGKAILNTLKKNSIRYFKMLEAGAAAKTL